MNGDSLGRLALFCSEQPLGWSTELSLDKRRIILTLPGTMLATDVRSRSWSEGQVREAYLKQENGSLQIYITLAQPIGYSSVWLPYSRCLLITPVRWEKLAVQEDLYHSALLALELGANTVADSLLTEAAVHGSADAATLLAVRSLAAGKPVTALQWIRRASAQNPLPDFYGVIAHLAELTGIPSIQSWAYSRFRIQAQCALPPLPPIYPDSLIAVTDAIIHTPLVDTSAFSVPHTVPQNREAHHPEKVDSGTTTTTAFSATETPEWLLVGAPLLFAGLAIVSVFLLVRNLLRATQRKAVPSESHAYQGTPNSPFPAYVNEALHRYRTVEEKSVHNETFTDVSPPAQPPPAEPFLSTTVSARDEVTTAQTSPSSSAPHPSAEPGPSILKMSPTLAHLWRQRVHHRSSQLRQQLQQLQHETIPASTYARARLARRLHIPQEGIELHLRLHSTPDFLHRFRTQSPPSFVSAAETEPQNRAEG
ncbi:MAG: hypothetical protein RMK93_00455 [Bacteroidota bacterium]|nr:hypothetical protein [Bacteroidota bacterium]